MKPFNAMLAIGATLTTVAAFPHMLRDMGVDLAEFEALAKRDGASGVRARFPEKRQTQLPVSINLPALTVAGLNIPNVIDIPGVITLGTKVIPDAAHPFMEPGPTDQRGGCPGLNIMANYGYTSRTGVISAGDILYACTEMLGYSVDLALVLVALAIRSGSMDVTTLKMSIGGKDARTNGLGSLVLGSVPGLFDYGVHNRYEVDGSMAYDDEYFHSTKLNAGGQFNGTRWAALQAVADANNGLFDINFHSENKYNAYKECIATNPTCTWNVVGSILFYAADTYTYLGMATTDPATGQITPPVSSAIQTFFGVQKSGSTYVHVAEKLPPGPDGHWYRRSVPLTTVEIAAQGVISYARHPVPFGANDGTHVNSFAPSDTQFSETAGSGAFCLILNQIQENDGVLGQQFSLFAGGIAAVLATLVAPARAGLSCGSQ